MPKPREPEEEGYMNEFLKYGDWLMIHHLYGIN
jgi:hypothetical protein